MLSRLLLSTASRSRRIAVGRTSAFRRSLIWSLTPKHEDTPPSTELDASKEMAAIDSIDNLLSVVSEYTTLGSVWVSTNDVIKSLRATVESSLQLVSHKVLLRSMT
jgi:hypothetical protein